MSPITVKALTITEHKSFKLSILEYPEPELAPDEFLIENVAVALNPVDWKQIANDWLTDLPTTNGLDTSGTIIKVGDKVEGFAVGDRVISFLNRKTARHAAYQTHSISAANRSAKLPPHYSFEAGVTIPLAFVTAAAALIGTLGVSIPTSAAPSNGTPILVWGGSSSVGAFAIQLAKLAGYNVFTTASPANHAYVRSLGAAEAFDHHDPDVVSKIRAAAGSNLSIVYDAISSHATLFASADAITAATGTVACIVGTPPASPLPHVQIVSTGARVAYEKPPVGQQTFAVLNALLERGELIANPVKIMPGGLNGVEAGLQLSRSGGVSAQKLVYRIADTQF